MIEILVTGGTDVVGQRVAALEEELEHLVGDGPLRNEVLTGIAAQTAGFLIIAAELSFADIRVVTFQLLLGCQLQTIVRGLFAAASTMLTRWVLARVKR